MDARTEAQLRAAGIRPESLPPGAKIDGVPVEARSADKRSDGWPGYRSKWEALYAMELDDAKDRGEILDWVYEGVTLRLTEAVVVGGKRRAAVRYKADFAVWLPGGRLRLVEIKGFAREKDVLRYKMARDKYRQVEFIMVRRVKGEWRIVL